VSKREEMLEDELRALKERLAYFTECQLATQEGAAMRKATSKSDLRRLESISAQMVEACRCAGVTVGRHQAAGFYRGGGSRLRERLALLEPAP
jgi:hypothetical protein